MGVERRRFLGVMAAVAASGVLGGRATAAAATVSVPDWMSALPDKIALNNLTIPGTHDTAARKGALWLRTQDLTLAEQLQLGIRFFDIRCRVTGDSFAIHHDLLYLDLMFGDVLIACDTYLKAHPKESVLMRVKQEYSSESDAVFLRIFNDYLDRRGWRRLFFLENRIPTVGEVRGKVVLLANVSGLPGIPWGGGSRLVIQDEYNVPTLFDMQAKWEKVLAHFTKAQSATDGKLYVNFASGTGAGAAPSSVAGHVNPQLRDYAVSWPEKFPVTQNRPGLGVVPMDYPEDTDGLVTALIRCNSDAECVVP
ncbi:phosphatidylinositol-specific phospholipase C [Allokutzneria multivorans]|uniref:1-phosphatidylinositol phosphodiesterase n=1 Tax=Allokutzneria multivorans TaxID=1142134 RepID=A0ABP7T3K2_9PSEU